MSSSNVCLYDSDCPGNQVCYTNVSWFKSNPSSMNGCLCSTYYGFSGSVCDQVLETGTSKFWLGSGIVNIVGFSLLIFISIFELARLWNHKLFGLRTEVIGIFQIIFASMFSIINQVGWIWGSQTPALAAYIPFDDQTRDKEALYHGVWQAFLALSGVSTCIACSTIAIVWIDVAHKAFKVSRGGSTMKDYAKRIAIFQVFFVIAVIIPITLQLAYVSLAISFLLQLIILVLYFVGNIMMHRVIYWLVHNTTTTSQPYTKMLKEMIRTTMGIYFSSLLVVIASSVELVSMITNWKELSMPDPSVAGSVVAAQLMSFGATLLQAFTLAFLHRCIDRRIRKNDSSNQVAAVESPPANKV